MSFKAFNLTRKKKLTKEFFYSWEMILVYLLIAINVLLMIFVSDVYFASGSIQTIIRCGMEISFMVLGMAFILILGEIDVSVASIMLLSAMVMGLTYENMVPASGEALAAITSVVMGVIAGGCCGLLNGILVSLIKMPSVITTIGTSFLFRGIVHVTLGGDFKSNFPKFFEPLAWDDIGGVIPISLILFLAFAVIFCIILHRSRFGRQLYLVGNNKDTANYSGVRVAKTKIIAFTIMGMTTALSTIIFVGRLGGIDYTMATGYELKVIAVVVLGGISTLGGKGKLYGPIIATFFMAFLLKSLDLFQVQQNVQKIAIGAILIIAVLAPRINRKSLLKFRLKFFTRKALRQIEGTDIPHNVDEAKKRITDLERPMNEAQFYHFLDQLVLTTNPINRKVDKQDIVLAEKKYKDTKALLKEARNDNAKYIEVRANIKKQKENLEKVKDEYALFTYVDNQEVHTILKLIKLNRNLVKEEISANSKKFINNYRHNHLTENNSNTLRYTSWKIKHSLKSSDVKKALRAYLIKQEALDNAKMKKSLTLNELMKERRSALINYYITVSEYKINSYYKRKRSHTNRMIESICKKNKETANEKK